MTRASCLALLAVLLVACPDEEPECTENDPCSARGEVCDLMTNTCVEVEVDRTTTEESAPAEFTDKAFAFHRGEVCVPQQVLAGSDIPIALRPCVHPCITLTNFKFQHNWSCRNAACDAWLAMWMAGNGDACPEDAFSDFDPELCTYPRTIETSMNIRFSDNSAVQGNLTLEIPYLTNADVESFAGTTDADAVIPAIEAAMFQYPRYPERIAGGQPISLDDTHAPPPADCSDETTCPCHPVGF